MSEDQYTEPTQTSSIDDDSREDARVFSKRLPIRIIPFWREGGGEPIKLRWPTDAEWIEADSMVKLLTTPAGRGATETRTTGDVKAAEWLCNKIRANGSEISTDDALEIYDQLSYYEVSPAVRDGRAMVVDMDIVGDIRTTHRLRVPSKMERKQFGRGMVRDKTLRRNVRESSWNTASNAECYDALFLSQEGYATKDDIPVNHKSAVVVEVLSAVEDFLEKQGQNSVFFG